jgi:hypothetical protein
VMTLGGGWASVKHAGEALKCSLRLYELASAIWDESTKRKCRVFVGWALLWHHQQQAQSGASESRSSTPAPHHLHKALWIFRTQLDVNSTAQDEANWNRCFAALNHWAFENNHQGSLLVCAHSGDAHAPSDTITPSTEGDGQSGNDVLGEWEHLFA